MIQKKKYEALRVIRDNEGATASEFASAYYGDKSKKMEAKKILENLSEESLVRTPYDPERFVISNLGLEKMAEYEANPPKEETISRESKKKKKK